MCQKKGIDGIEIEIRYELMTEQLAHIVNYIQQSEYVIEGFSDNKICYIPLNDIMYFDIANRKTFIYTANNVCECKKNILAIENELSNTTIIRISKSTLLNISALVGVKPYPNHRLLAELHNGEFLIVSRKYIPALQEKIRSEYRV